MDIDASLALLGGLSPRQFMKRHWHKKPLLVRGAIAAVKPPLSRAQLFALAARDEVESRLVVQSPPPQGGRKPAARAMGVGAQWTLQRGPFARRSLPPVQQPHWTLLVQGVDLHDDAARDLLDRFRFVPDARLDDLMISYATDGGGVGPHFDSYDVFLLQVQGRRRWRIGRQKDLSLRDDVPLKILSRFEPEQEWVLEPGDMLYLPPRWAHDGIAEGECMTCSIGFRAPQRGELARELLQRMADAADDEGRDSATSTHAAAPEMYADPSQGAAEAPAMLPEAMLRYARDAVQRALRDPQALARALGEYLTEPKAQVWFEPPVAEVDTAELLRGVRLDRRTRMLCDARHVFINGDSLRAGGADARLMQRLASERFLSADDLRRASDDACAVLQEWCEAGWVHAIAAQPTAPPAAPQPSRRSAVRRRT